MEKPLGVPVSKIRPASESSDAGQGQPSHQYHLHTSKVQPAVIDEPNEPSPISPESPPATGSIISPSPSSLQRLRSFLNSDEIQKRLDLGQIAEDSEPQESLVGTRVTTNHFVVPPSKVRPFLAVSDHGGNSHQYHLHANKVRPFTDFEAQNDDDQDALVRTSDEPHPPSALVGHSISEDEKFDTEGQPEHHVMIKDVPVPLANAGPSYGVEDDKQHAVLAEPHGHQIQDDQSCPGETFLDEHSISACGEFPVYAPQRHSMRSCEKSPMQPPPEAHIISQCPEYDVWKGPNLHQMQADVKYPLGMAGIHRSSHCETYPMQAGPAQHTLSIDAQYPTTQPGGQHGLGTCSQYPSASSPFNTSKWAPGSDILSTERYWDLREAHGNIQRARPSQNPGRSHSDTSGLDYKRTIEWLRDLLGYPEQYSPELTRLPSRQKTLKDLPLEQRRISEPLPPKSPTSRRLTQKSTYSVSSNPKVDGQGFQRVVSDLERLLNEAVALASQVVDSPDSPDARTDKKLSTGQCLRTSARTDDAKAKVTEPSSVYDSGEEQSRLGSTDTEQAKRPLVPHAATFSGQSPRPRLQDIVQKYSGNDENLMTNDIVARPRRATTPRRLTEDVKIYVPQRKSSRVALKPQAPPKALRKRKSTKIPPPVDHLPCDEKELVDFDVEDTRQRERPVQRSAISQHVPHQYVGDEDLPQKDAAGRQMPHEHGISLRHKSHVSLHGVQGFSLPRSRRRQPIARDWSPLRKKFVATIACLSTALVGVLLGIYAGLVPRIQYYILDESHSTIYGNTGCFLGLAVPTFCFWPLPLLHGRKPYILSGLVLAMPLLFPQALSVMNQRLTHTGSWRAMLIASRTLMGGALGFASMNFHSILTDLFGCSLMSSNPHEEVVNEYDARRHGGGMGVWLGIWTWCWIGSLGVGFLIGASIIDSQPPVWGFYVSIIIIAVVLFLNVLSPEVRRSSYRRSVAEIRTGSDISRRLARGETKMHRVKTGPKWWGEEVYHGIVLSLEMLRQPGFAVVAVYSAWIYAQVVLIIVLLGSLASNVYRLSSPSVGLYVGATALGALLAVPFQKANLFSRSRRSKVNSNRATLEKRMAWTSHLLRRAVFTILLPIAGGCYAAVSSGPPIHISGPAIFAIFIGFLSSLAISECNGLIMETFDTSDLWPGMTGRQRGEAQKRTNYSSFPRATAGFAIIHTLAFIFAAGATALGGYITRTLGQQVTTGLVAGILFFFTILLLLVIVRWKKVKIIPESKTKEMEKLVDARRKSTALLEAMPDDPQALEEDDQAWRPVMMGNPVTKARRMNLLELGNLSRWQEIRKRNKLIDEGAHPNLEALDQGLEALDEHFRSSAQDLLQRGLRGKSSRVFQKLSDGDDLELDNWHAATAGESSRRTPFGTPFLERDCFIGQTVQEEDENEADDQRRRR